MGTNAFYHHKTVLMTGGAGSIGSQLVRMLLDANPRAVILTDNNEGALYDLEQDLKSSKVSTFVADVKDNTAWNRFLTALILFSTSQGSRTFQCANITPMKLLKRISLGLTTWSIYVCARTSEK